MLNTIFARALTVLAVEGGGGTGGQTQTEIINDDTFAIPRLILQIMSIGFLFYAIFKIVEAVAKSSWPTAIGFVVSAAFVLFIAWNPTALLSLLNTLGSFFQNLFELIST